jgi:ring-1,2-phenylacetyl-CoA epoxidase subunit PaaC
MDDHYFRYLLRHGDRCLVLAQRLCEWITHAPDLEEDVAFANIGLDLLGQARVLLTRAGEVEDRGRGEDELSFLRSDRQFLNVQLVELANGDFAFTTVRRLFHDAWALPLWQALGSARDDVLAGLGEKAAKEVAYHLRHARTWVLRLGDGTEESRRRMQAAVDGLWRFTGELFEVDEVEEALLADGMLPADVDPRALLDPWRSTVLAVLTEAGLTVPDDVVMATGGRTGVHTEALGYLLAEMQALPRAHQGARW